jgi:MFS family permease
VKALRRYGELLARPGVRSAVVLSMLCRLPMGMTPLAVLLLVRAETGSFATAGLTTGVYAAAVALVSPLRARMVDRSGMALVLATSGVLHPLGLLGLLVAVRSGVPDVAVVALALVSGLAFPPVAPVMRALWTSLVPDEAGRRSAFSLEAILVETAFVLGPLGVALVLALGSAGVLVAVGSLGLATSGLVRGWTPEREWRAASPGR